VYRFEQENRFLLYYLQRHIQGGGLWGLNPPGPEKSIDFRGVSGPNGCLAPPRQIPEYAPGLLVRDFIL